jgi:hypothetical protein
MRRQGGSGGFVILLVVLAVVLFIALNNFKSTAPAALAIQKQTRARESARETPPAQATDDSWTPTPPARPSLSQVDQKTSEHSAAVESALSQSE